MARVDRCSGVAVLVDAGGTVDGAAENRERLRRLIDRFLHRVHETDAVHRQEHGQDRDEHEEAELEAFVGADRGGEAELHERRVRTVERRGHAWTLTAMRSTVFWSVAI